MAQAHHYNPFTEFTYAAPVDPFERVAETANDDERSRYAMVKSAPAVDSAECELRNVASLEVMILWGDNVLHVAHLTPPRAFYVGEQSTKDAPCDFVLPAERIGATRVALIEIIDGAPQLVVPPGARVDGGAPALAVVGERRVVALAAEKRTEIKMGDLIVRVMPTCAGKPTPRTLFGAMRSSFGAFGIAAAACAAFVGAMAYFTPNLGLLDDEGVDQDRAFAAQQYLMAAAEREKETAEVQTPDAPATNGGAERGAAAKGAAGSMGKPLAAAANKRFAVKGPADNADPHIARQAALRDAREFGMIGLLTSVAGDPDAPTAPWGRDAALGTDDRSANGNMWGDQLGESRGTGGLGPSGIGEGGGGFGEGIGLDRVNTCGKDVCPGLGGFGKFTAPGAPGHTTRVPSVRPYPTTVVGSLPGEVIQRIVRQNFGRFRQCYENGLRTNPNLAGRVTVRFVIGRDGSVSNASNGGSDLPDSGVVSCVVSAYYGLSFPAPENGIVTVNYPIAFSPG